MGIVIGDFSSLLVDMFGLIVEEVVLLGFFVSFVVLVFCEIIEDMCVWVCEMLIMIVVLFLL